MARLGARSRCSASSARTATTQPLAYDIRDELSTTISANPFDYDFNPIALAQFRDWLKTQYADLAALNAEWETQFASWDEVKPFTTDQIKNRMASGDALPRGKPDWQAVQRLKFDPAEARAGSPRAGTSRPGAISAPTWTSRWPARWTICARPRARVDPRTPVGIEGTQMPHAFGGYDLWRLSQVLDWVEPYDIGNAREIFGSFMPGKPILTTVFEKDTNARPPPALASAARRRPRLHRLVERGLHRLEEPRLRAHAQGQGAGAGAEGDDLAAGAALPARRARARPDLHPLLAAQHPGGLAAGIHRGWLDLAAAVLQLRGRPQPHGAGAQRLAEGIPGSGLQPAVHFL